MGSIKVVWLCHFTNNDIQIKLNPHKRISESAPWISSLIKLFERIEEIELHIVSPHEYISFEKYFMINGIHYHFFNPHIPIWGRHWPVLFKFDLWTNYRFNKIRIANIIKKIKPELVHLHGAENAYYSSGVLPLFEKYPTLITIQGFIRNTSYKGIKIKKRIIIEEAILIKAKNIGVCTQEMTNTVITLNPKAKIYTHDYPTTIPQYTKNDESLFDIVFFARVSRDKGIEDLLKAVSIVKKECTNISLHIIGSTGNKYLSYLKTLCYQLSIENNVKFLGFLPTQEDVYRNALQAKICVLPTYHDIIPGTIVESMYMKLPVIAYAVGGIPELNKNEETIILVDKHNIEQLAEKIILLLTNIELRKQLAERAYNYVNKRFDNNKMVSDILNAYKSILKDNDV